MPISTGLYATDKTPWEDKIIYEHFFIGGCDWYAAEYSPDELIFFGYAILDNDLDNSEWGYFSFDEMREVKPIFDSCKLYLLVRQGVTFRDFGFGTTGS